MFIILGIYNFQGSTALSLGKFQLETADVCPLHSILFGKIASEKARGFKGKTFDSFQMQDSKADCDMKTRKPFLFFKKKCICDNPKTKALSFYSVEPLYNWLCMSLLMNQFSETKTTEQNQ